MSKTQFICGIAAAALAAALIGGCATPQENPHYRYSSKMEQQTQPSNTQYASTPYQQPAPATQRYVETQYPEPVPFESVSSPSYDPGYELAGGPNMLPAQDADWDMDMVETGGQNAGNAGTLIYQDAAIATPENYLAEPSVAPQAQIQPQTQLQAPLQIQPSAPAQTMPLDGPAQQTVTISGPIYMAGDDYAPQILNQRNTVIGTQYVVQEGDNVYRLSKTVCATSEDIQSMNGLDAAFTIRAGEIIQLPASRC